MWMKSSGSSESGKIQIGAERNLDFAADQMAGLQNNLQSLGVHEPGNLVTIMQALAGAMPPVIPLYNQKTNRITEDWISHLLAVLSGPNPLAALETYASQLVRRFNSYGQIPGVYIGALHD